MAIVCLAKKIDWMCGDMEILTREEEKFSDEA